VEAQFSRLSKTRIALAFFATSKSPEGLGLSSPLFQSFVMKHRILHLILIAAVLPIAVLAIFISVADKSRYKNDFIRTFPPDVIVMSTAVKFEHSRLSIAGVADQSIYFQSGAELFALDLNLQDIRRIALDNSREMKVTIDSPYFYFQVGNEATLQRGDIVTWCVDTIFKSIPAFTGIQPISKSSSILQVIDLDTRTTFLTKTSGAPSLRTDIPHTQAEGIISADGILQYSKKENILVYVYRYSNQFVCMDTSLRIQYVGKTIDTTSVARISTIEIEGKITMSKPPFVVNKFSFVDGKNLFVHSNLVARNESIDYAAHQSVIDIYNIIDGVYRFSFYVPDHENTKMRSFHVRGSTFFAVFPNHIVRCDLAGSMLL
jgi:hypothetical protein